MTAQDPKVLSLPNQLVDITTGTWVLCGGSVNHDDEIIKEEYGQDLDSLEEGDTVGVMRTSSGELHFYVNGVDQGVACTGIPPTVYAAVDVFGQCTQVTIVHSASSAGGV